MTWLQRKASTIGIAVVLIAVAPSLVSATEHPTKRAKAKSGSAIRAGLVDVCEEKVPQSLRRELAKAFPGFRLALSTDQRSDDEDWNRVEYKPGTCRTVVKEDFDGDGHSDVATYLVQRDSGTVKLIAALSRSKGWRVTELGQWNAHILGLYAERARPGIYAHTDSFEFKPSDANEREHITVKKAALMAGTVESSGVVYAYQGGRWLYVWVSD